MIASAGAGEERWRLPSLPNYLRFRPQATVVSHPNHFIYLLFLFSGLRHRCAVELHFLRHANFPRQFLAQPRIEVIFFPPPPNVPHATLHSPAPLARKSNNNKKAPPPPSPFFLMVLVARRLAGRRRRRGRNPCKQQLAQKEPTATTLFSPRRPPLPSWGFPSTFPPYLACLGLLLLSLSLVLNSMTPPRGRGPEGPATIHTSGPMCSNLGLRSIRFNE